MMMTIAIYDAMVIDEGSIAKVSIFYFALNFVESVYEKLCDNNCLFCA